MTNTLGDEHIGAQNRPPRAILCRLTRLTHAIVRRVQSILLVDGVARGPTAIRGRRLDHRCASMIFNALSRLDVPVRRKISAS